MRAILYMVFIFSIAETYKTDTGLRIIGGKDASSDQYPFVVGVELRLTFPEPVSRVEYEHVCTGAVIAPTWTLTASHCIMCNVNRVKIIADVMIKYAQPGNGTMSEGIYSEVVYSVKHPYFKKDLIVVRNDIGLYKTRPITLKQYAKLSAVDYQTIIGQEVTLCGYGVTKSEDKLEPAKKLGKPLQIMEAMIIRCTRATTGRFISNVSPSLCLRNRCSQSSGLCGGDSGGPVLHPSGVVAINTAVKSDNNEFCKGQLKRPLYTAGIVTVISPFIDWITYNMNKDPV